MRSRPFFGVFLGVWFVAAKVKQENEGEEKRERGKEETHFTAISFTLRIAVDEKNRLLRRLWLQSTLGLALSRRLREMSVLKSQIKGVKKGRDQL